MTRPRIELFVLDAHGVVLSNALPGFLAQVARLTGQDDAALRARWTRELRRPAWTGAIRDDELWRRLSNGAQGDWRALLERSFGSGPAAPHLARWAGRVPLWILSNHRSHWLEERLQRFGLRDLFERVLVSDQLGRVKPEAGAFAPVLEHVASPESVLFLDDRMRNIESARALGLNAILLREPGQWRARVDRWIAAPSVPAPR